MEITREVELRNDQEFHEVRAARLHVDLGRKLTRTLYRLVFGRP